MNSIYFCWHDGVSICVGYEHVLLFRPGQCVVSFRCFGRLVMAVFSSSVRTKFPARFRINSTSLTHWLSASRCPELTPKLTRCQFLSSLQVSKGNSVLSTGLYLDDLSLITNSFDWLICLLHFARQVGYCGYQFLKIPRKQYLKSAWK